MHWQLAVLAVILLGFAAVSARVDGTWITAPMIFTAAGLVVGVEALDLVKNVQEAPELGAQLLASLVRQLGISGLTSGKKRSAEERPRVAVARSPDESGLGNRNGKQRGEPRQDGQLTLHARDRDRTTREAERPLLLDHPDRVVPALAEQPSGCRVELRELVGEKRAHERLVDDDVGVPLGHRGTVPLGRVASL